MHTALANSCVEHLSQNFVLAGCGNRVLLEKLDIATEGTDQGDGLGFWDTFHAGCFGYSARYWRYSLERGD